MADNGYDAVLHAIEQLSDADRERLMSALAAKMPNQTTGRRPHSILESRGLGKEVWAGVDPDDYVEQERSSWNG